MDSSWLYKAGVRYRECLEIWKDENDARIEGSLIERVWNRSSCTFSMTQYNNLCQSCFGFRLMFKAISWSSASSQPKLWSGTLFSLPWSHFFIVTMPAGFLSRLWITNKAYNKILWSQKFSRKLQRLPSLPQNKSRQSFKAWFYRCWQSLAVMIPALGKPIAVHEARGPVSGKSQ